MKKNLVRDWMTPNPITIDPKTTLPEVHRLMKECHIRRLPVIDKGELIGIVTLGDVREAGPSDATSLNIYEMNYLIARLTIDRIMTRKPITVSPNATVQEAAKLMMDNKISGLPVVDLGKLVGVITESDVFRVLVLSSDLNSEN